MEGSHNIELCVKHTYISLILADASGWNRYLEWKEKKKKARGKMQKH